MKGILYAMLDIYVVRYKRFMLRLVLYAIILSILNIIRIYSARHPESGVAA